MNEQLEKIWDKARDEVEQTNPQSWKIVDVREKFAEMIVKDCIAEVLMYDCSSVNSDKETYLDGFIDGTERGYKDAVEQIAEGLALRYGVEQ